MKKAFLCALALGAFACSKSDAGGAAPPADSSAYGANADVAPPQQFAMAGPMGQQAPRGAARNYMRFEPAVIVDATGFERPIGAASLFIPHGWRTEGGVYWASDFLCVNGYNFLWSATSPDGSMSLGISPQAAWAFASGVPASPQPGCPTVAIASVRQYLEASLQQSMPGARVLDYRDRPDLVAEVGAKPQRTPMPMGEIQSWAEGGEILFAFQQGGRDMRGTSAAVVQFQKMITDMSSIYGNDPTIMQMPQQSAMRTESVNAFAHPGFVATAPNGQLNPAFFEALRKTIKPNPQWAARIAGHNAAIGRVALEESRKRSAMIARSNEEISRIRQETWNAYQESADRRAREFGELMKGVETWSDADSPGGTVELSRSDHAWRLNDGSYILTDDPNFDPWRDLQLEGRRLEAVQ
ncbi:MAG: hypothetical protein HXY21_05915 [Parvularculaceae bacterium]|nr:hypothetical protein [Parvularculaceae bacterium]